MEEENTKTNTYRLTHTREKHRRLFDAVFSLAHIIAVHKNKKKYITASEV